MLQVYITYFIVKKCVSKMHIEIAPHLLSQFLRKRLFWGVNRHFQAKRAKYSNFYTIELICIDRNQIFDKHH